MSSVPTLTARTEGIQSKRYQEFTVADLNKAVDKYTGSTLPFTLVRFAVGVACKVDDRAVGERKAVLNEQLHPLEIDVWDRSRISEMLRDKPEIVMKYFGPRTAERFCVPHVLVPVEIAGPDAVATADAVLHGPLAIADAQGLLDKANDLATTDPASALARYRDVQHRLTEAGFPGHAAELNQTVAALCVGADEERAAIRLLMDELWAAESSANNLRADRVAGALRDLAGLPMFGSGGTPRTPALGAAFEIADFVTDHLHAPVPTRLELPLSATALADDIDRARTILFAAERALADDDPAWVIRHQQQIESASTEVSRADEDVAVRLRLALADATGDWTALIQDARTRMRRELKALTRHARYLLLQAAYMDADNEWSEAVEAACLAQRHDDAADWLYSQMQPIGCTASVSWRTGAGESSKIGGILWLKPFQICPLVQRSSPRHTMHESVHSRPSSTTNPEPRQSICAGNFSTPSGLHRFSTNSMRLPTIRSVSIKCPIGHLVDIWNENWT